MSERRERTINSVHGDRVSQSKIELHVHLEGSVRPATLLEIARRNDVALPVDTVEELEKFYQYTDFSQFIEIWLMTDSMLSGNRTCPFTPR